MRSTLPVVRSLFLALLACFCLPQALAHDGAKFEPADGKLLHGAGQCDGIEKFIASTGNYSAALASSVGSDALHPFLTKRYYSLYERESQKQAAGVISFAQMLANKLDPLSAWLATEADGLMPEISVSFALYAGVWPDQLISAGALDVEIRALAQVLKAFGAPCFVRLGFEPNTLAYNAFAAYRDSYRHIVDLFREEQVENVAWIWCAGPANGVQMAQVDPAQGAWWYPGDAYVDWVGIDVFTRSNFDQSQGHNSYWSFWSMLELADAWKKPVILSETSALFMDGTDWGIKDPSPAAAAYYWSEWFQPFFDTLDQHPRIKAWSYVNWNWEDTPWPWPDARIENNAHLVDLLAQELTKPRYIHRDTPDKFSRPYFTHGGVQTMGGQVARLAGGNADPGGSGLPAQVFHLVSFSKMSAPPTPGFLDYQLGVAALGQYWFLGGGSQLLAVNLASASGAFELQLSIPQGLSGLTAYFQAVVVDPVTGAASLSQPLELQVQ
jgi:hypothetical protein